MNIRQDVGVIDFHLQLLVQIFSFLNPSDLMVNCFSFKLFLPFLNVFFSFGLPHSVWV